jgi:hypothetical protein
VTELVTDSDRTPDGEATSTSINEAVSFGEHEPQLARARDDAEPTGDPENDATADTDSDALRAVYDIAGRAGGALRTALAGPAAWPVIASRHPSVLEVWQHGRDGAGWDHPALLARWPARAYWIFDALWETGCMTARVWWRTRITWAITILLVVAYVVWGR